MPRLQINVCTLDGELLDQFFVEIEALNDVAASRMLSAHIENKFESGETVAELDACKDDDEPKKHPSWADR